MASNTDKRIKKIADFVQNAQAKLGISSTVAPEKQEPQPLPPALTTIAPETTQAPRATPTSPEVFKNETGRNSGITLPDGRTFLGLAVC